MDRAAVLIGVKRTGNLPELQAVYTGVQQMAEWATSQGITGDRLKVLTDKSEEVRAYQIKDAIKEFARQTTIEQLIVYFSGHGIHNRGDYWLLSQAPHDSDEAVNVEGSAFLARYCGLGHIVLISDACRTAARDIQAQDVKGSDIFPNDEHGSGLERPVDLFFACARGKPAFEVKDPLEAANQFEAIYTKTLAECLRGNHVEVLDYEDDDHNTIGLVRLRKLNDFLRDSVSKRLREKLKKAPTINQTPDARIVSDNTWLSRIPRLSRTEAFVEPVSRSAAINPFTISETLVSHALIGNLQHWRDVLNIAGDVPEASPLKDAAVTLSTPFGPSHFETRCGFKLRGGKVSQVFCKEATAEILDSDGTIVRVGQSAKPGAVVLLQIRNGTGVAIPALPDFIAELTFEGNELVNVSYEPSDNTWRWGEYVIRREELRALRASVAASVGLGMFRLNGDDALALAQRMEIARGIDPSLSLYAAYAYHDLQRRDLIKRAQSCLRANLGVTFFDVSLLAGDRPGELPGSDRVTPPFPLLSQGWSLLSALRAQLPGSLQTLHQHLLPSSLWTMFDETGVAMLAAAINSREVR